MLGHHPHVLQPVERVGTGLVAYSLGNFLFDQDWTAETRLGGILDVDIGRQGVTRWAFLPTENDHRCRPRPASGMSAERAREIIRADRELAWDEYRALLSKDKRRHRMRMKMELVRNARKVSWDTIHFLLTKRGRRRRMT